MALGTPSITYERGIDGNCDKNSSHGTVCVYQPGCSSNKGFCSIKLCFFQCVINIYVAFIFRVTGQTITYVDKQVCLYAVILFWKNIY